jgi:hypothetical protein
MAENEQNQQVQPETVHSENRVIPGRNGGTLHPFAKGNPLAKHGRGKGNVSLTTIIKEIAKCKAPEEAQRKLIERYPNIKQKHITRAHLWMARMDQKACEGDVRAIENIWDRVDGKVPSEQSIKISNENVIESLSKVAQAMMSSDLTPEQQESFNDLTINNTTTTIKEGAENAQS